MYNKEIMEKIIKGRANREVVQLIRQIIERYDLNKDLDMKVKAARDIVKEKSLIDCKSE